MIISLKFHLQESDTWVLLNSNKRKLREWNISSIFQEKDIMKNKINY